MWVACIECVECIKGEYQGALWWVKDDNSGKVKQMYSGSCVNWNWGFGRELCSFSHVKWEKYEHMCGERCDMWVDVAAVSSSTTRDI